jgi:sugar O-acyltransferase (sialic acid O-acetyltransferase NeuD family)
MKEKIILIGGGGHCRACIDVIEQEGRFAIAGIVDMPEKQQQTVLEYPVIGLDADLVELIKTFPNVLITLGQIKSPIRRMELFDDLVGMGARFPMIKSPLAYVSPRTKIGDGTIVMHHAVVNAGADIGRNCIINTKALVEHDAVVEDHCHVSTGAIVNGGVRIGRSSFFGSGAVSQEYTSVPPNSFIRANSLYRKSDE